jgi:hypothetical protein
VYGFQGIRVNAKRYGVFRQFFYGIDQLICRCGVEVARQFQIEAVAVSIDGYSKI